jgi:hypothetical protein
MGKPLGDILGVYVGQMGEYTQALTLNAPSVFSLIPPGIRLDAQLASRFGILAAFVMTLAVLALLFPLRVKLDNEILLTALIILAVGIPFLLPYMHERYFFAADTLTLVWACTDTGHIFQAAGIQAASLGGYHAYLRLRYAFPLTLLGYSIPMGIEAMIVLLVLLSAAVILGQKIGHTHQ